jgi:nucleotide-binding universal stress UspA family protein
VVTTLVISHELDTFGQAAAARASKGAPEMKRILVAYDGTEPSRRALETAAELAHAFGASVAVVSVVPLHGGRIGIDPWDDRSVHARELIEAKNLLREKGVEARLIEPVGETAPTIERVAREGDFDTIVLGSRGLGPIERVLQGSVSQHIVTHADATVVVTH